MHIQKDQIKIFNKKPKTEAEESIKNCIKSSTENQRHKLLEREREREREKRRTDMNSKERESLPFWEKKNDFRPIKLKKKKPEREREFFSERKEESLLEREGNVKFGPKNGPVL